MPSDKSKAVADKDPVTDVQRFIPVRLTHTVWRDSDCTQTCSSFFEVTKVLAQATPEKVMVVGRIFSCGER